MDYPIDQKQLNKLKKAITKSLQKTKDAHDKQVDEMVKFLAEKLTWGEFTILAKAISKFMERGF